MSGGTKMKIGVITDCFKLPLADSIKLAGELGFDGIQVYATTGEFSPEVLNDERKAEIKALLKENNLEIHKLTTEGEERNSHIFGFHPNPNQAQIDALKRRNQDLISRKRELNK